MLELFGSGYVIEHCIAVFKNKQEERLYRSYVAECLKTTAQMAGRNAGVEVQIVDFREINGWVKNDARTGDEIAADIIKRAGLRIET